MVDLKKLGGFLTKKLIKYIHKKRKICKDIIDNLFEIGKDFKNLDSKDFYQFIQMRLIIFLIFYN